MEGKLTQVSCPMHRGRPGPKQVKLPLFHRNVNEQLKFGMSQTTLSFPNSRVALLLFQCGLVPELLYRLNSSPYSSMGRSDQGDPKKPLARNDNYDSVTPFCLSYPSCYLFFSTVLTREKLHDCTETCTTRTYPCSESKRL